MKIFFILTWLHLYIFCCEYLFQKTFQQFINNSNSDLESHAMFFAKRADLPEEYPDAPAYLDVGFALGCSRSLHAWAALESRLSPGSESGL